MPNVPTLCMVCGYSAPNDQDYVNHISMAHGTEHPDEAFQTNRAVQSNTPKGGPVLIGEGIPPSPEFEEVMSQIQKDEQTAKQQMAQTKPNDDSQEPVGGGMSEADIQKLRDLGLPSEIPTPAKGKKPQETVPNEKVDPIPIQLHYQYEGNCKKCFSEVETIMIKAKGTLNAVAYCNNCKKQVKTIEVTPIKNDEVV